MITIPAIIFNFNYHFTTLKINNDGTILCWETLDFNSLQKRLNDNWLVTAIPNEKEISISDLGCWQIDEGKWLYNKESYYQYLQSLLKNPTQTSGPTSEIFQIFYRTADQKIYLANLTIFPEGTVELTNLPEQLTFPFSELEQFFATQKILTNPPLGSKIEIFGFGSFKIIDGEGESPEDKYQEFVDVYNVLRGGEGTVEKCRRIFAAYKANPSPQIQEELKQAYEAVPNHHKLFVGDMDTKDHEVRRSIYPKN